MTETLYLPQSLYDAVSQLYNRNHMKFAALRFVSKLFQSRLAFKDDFKRLSAKYVQHIVSKKSSLKVIDILMQNSIVERIFKKYPDKHLACAYVLNPKYILNQLKKPNFVTINITEYLNQQQIDRFESKKDYFFQSAKDFVSVKQNRQMIGEETATLLDRLLSFEFNQNKLDQIIHRVFDDNTTVQDIINGNTIITNTQQTRLMYVLLVIHDKIQIEVRKGQKGGRLHHPFCNFPKEIWECIEPKDQSLVKVSIDVNACQVVCLNKLVKMPDEVIQMLKQGRFYEFINEKMFGNKKSRQQVKQFVFSKMFTGRKAFWEKWQLLGYKYSMYCDEFMMLLDYLEQNHITLAAMLQRVQSRIFNQIYHQTEKSLIRYDELVFLVEPDKAIQKIQQIIRKFEDYFGFIPALHVSINNKQIDFVLPL